uniref:Uncharacterized protein n=1 Tax=Anopheles merus TaxID=30066 RepID=A0A182VP44_ANOME
MPSSSESISVCLPFALLSSPEPGSSSSPSSRSLPSPLPAAGSPSSPSSSSESMMRLAGLPCLPVLLARERDRDRERDREPEPDRDRERDPEPDREREREPEPERERERDCERERDRERDREPDPERDRDRDGVRTRRCDDRRLPERLRLRLTLAEWLPRRLRDRRLWRDRLRLLREPASLTSEPLRRRRRSGCDVWLSREPLRLRCGECIFPSSPSDAAVSSTVASASFSLSTGAEGTAASSCCCCCCCSFPSPASATVWAVSSGCSFGSTVGSSSLMVVFGSSPFGGCGTTATGSPLASIAEKPHTRYGLGIQTVLACSSRYWGGGY